MQKIIVSLILIVGVVSAVPTWGDNNTWSKIPIQVSNATADPSIWANSLRLVSSDDNLVLIGQKKGENNVVEVNQRIVSPKDLKTGKNSTTKVTVTNQTILTHRDTSISLYIAKDSNGYSQVYITTVKITSDGASKNPRAITNFKSNFDLTIWNNSLSIQTYSKKVYVVVHQNDTCTLVGTDIDGSSNSLTNLTNDPQMREDSIRCASIAGSKDLYCAWSINDTIYDTRIDPSKDKAGSITATDVDQSSNIVVNIDRAWSTASAYGVIYQRDVEDYVRSVDNNKTLRIVHPTGRYLVGAYPMNDRLGLFWQTLDSNSLYIQYVEKNGSVINEENVNLERGIDSAQIVQHKTGGVYILSISEGQAYIGEVWGDIHLDGSVLQTTFYACLALITALIAF